MANDLVLGQLPGQNFYCRLKIKGVEIASTNVISLTIREWVLGIVSKLELVLGDAGALLEVVTLEDNDEIDITISKYETTDNILQMKFYLSDYYVNVSGDNRFYQINISGFQKVDKLFIMNNRSFGQQTSLEVLTKLSTEMGSKLNNKYNLSTSDKMNWYQLNTSNLEFIKHVLKRSYVYNDVIFYYIDHTNQFIFTSLNKEIDKKESKIAKFSVESTEFKEDENDKTIYFNSYDVNNLSGYFNKVNNYGTTVQYYDLTNYKSQEFNTFKKLTELTHIDKNYYQKNVFNLNWGMYNNLNLYSEKYYESLIRNNYLISNFFGYSLAIQIDANEKVELFDKINVALPSNISGDLNKVMSGNYLVGGIIHNISNNGIYKKMLSLHRNGMNKSQFNITNRNKE